MRHIIAILLQNEAGALSRVAGLFSTRGYNIESLSVAPTHDPTVSRLTLVTKGSDAVIQQIVNHLNKLIDVVNVLDMTRGEHLERELVLLKLRVAPGDTDTVRGQVVRSGGRVLDPAVEDSSSSSPRARRKSTPSSAIWVSAPSSWRWCAAARSASAAAPGRCGHGRRRRAPRRLASRFPVFFRLRHARPFAGHKDGGRDESGGCPLGVLDRGGVQVSVLLDGLGDDEIIHLGGHETSRRRENAGKNTGAIAIERGDAALLGASDDRPGCGGRSRHRFVQNEGSRQIAFCVEMPHSERDCYTSLVVSFDRIRSLKAREGETGRVGLRRRPAG